MFLNFTATKFNTAIKAFAVLALCVTVLIFSADCSSGALNGLNFCFGVLIPSLFPFMAISSFIVKSGLSSTLGKPFGGVTKKLFGLNRCFAPVIILSVLGGYPVGAKGISALYKNKNATRAEAEKASLFAVCAGPGFLINFVGVSLYGNEKIGLILLVSQIISVFIIGIFINICDRKKENYNSNAEITHQHINVSNAIVDSAIDSSKGMLMICAFVVLFSAFASILKSILSEGIFESCVLCLLEVCSASDSLSKNYPVEFVAFAVGFGGICVHFQIFSALENINVSKLLFFCIRIIQGVITALLTHLGLQIFTDAKEVFSTATVTGSTLYGGTILSGVALVAVALCFLYSLKFCKNH